MSDYNQFVEHRHLTDDRDLPRRTELIVVWAPNGDFYLGTAPENAHSMHMVRVCTSGGSASRNPALVKAVRELFEALGGFKNEEATDAHS